MTNCERQQMMRSNISSVISNEYRHQTRRRRQRRRPLEANWRKLEQPTHEADYQSQITQLTNRNNHNINKISNSINCSRVPPITMTTSPNIQTMARVRNNINTSFLLSESLTCSGELDNGSIKTNQTTTTISQSKDENMMTRVKIVKYRQSNMRSNIAASIASVFVLICLSVILMPPLAQVKHSTIYGAVIRPTIFSDLPPDTQQNGQQLASSALNTPTTQQQNNQQQQASQTSVPQAPNIHQTNSQQQQQQQQQQTQLSPISGHYLNNHLQASQTHWHQGVSHQADGPQQQQQPQSPPPPQQQQQKINPLKSRFCTGPNGQRLDHSLGLQSFAIDDLSLTASSYSNEQVRPHLARLNLDILGGAWCPMKPISSSNFGKEWIQVKLNRSFVVSAIETQGRFGLGSGKEFVPSYQVEYSRNNGLTWHKWKDFRGSSLLRANEDVQTAVRNELSPPIVGANVIRLLPFSQHLRTVCLRFELYGCQYDEGAPLSYTTNDGVVEPRWGHLIDYTYDGLRHRSGQLSGGLGQLVDGVKGPDNFQFNNGFEWVGWKSMNGDLVVEFAFKTLRNFTGALFYSNNLFSSGVEVFQAVDVHYGIDVGLSMDTLRDSLQERRRRRPTLSSPSGATLGDPNELRLAEELNSLQQAPAGQQTVWSSDVLSIEYEPDKKAESSRPVTVHLKQRLANKLRFVLKFASKWILISEVEFLSRPVELMSLASLNEQLTPKLLLDLQQAKSYDEYVAILREHQLRRIAADEYLQMGAAGSSTLGTTEPVESSTAVEPGNLDANGEQQSGSKMILSSSSNNQEQQADEQTPSSSASSSSFNSLQAQLLAKRLVTPTNQWLQSNSIDLIPNSQYGGAPATNPLLTNPTLADFGPVEGANNSPFGAKEMNSNNQNDLLQMQQQGRRTVSLTTVISFVFVGVIVILGTLFAVSSYRLRRAHLKSAPVAGLQHRMGSEGKNFLAGSTTRPGQHQHSASSCSSSGNSVLNTMNAFNRQHEHNSPVGQHYNPLFANSSREGSIKKSGPLSSLKRLATLTSGSNSKTMQTRRQRQQQTEQQLRSSFAIHSNNGQMFAPTTLNQNQLLVSLKDSKQAQPCVSTQLIVGLNQANPLAQQQIYNSNQLNQHHQQQLYSALQAANYSATTNSISLASSSTTGGAAGDYATPDIQPIIRSSGNNQMPSSQMSSLMGHEHNYEQINDSQLTPIQRPTLHGRTFSNQLAAAAAANCQHPFGATMTSARPQANNSASSSHYYYADTEASKRVI